ncbi:nuclear transport factor 2 family protein [Spirosoma sp. BT702]|uniref:Nuclear transport factor 2 family protein n=1 Tax=Spirosoma profusum TaxID=2771354 RepID=A0A926Y2M3_9BACT|nr:nuclear transport factor 2 family protein [Spirosoma profusum]MBD2703217.1 nuclear transport factor 2 family protein [Spirosoma profusum]
MSPLLQIQEAEDRLMKAQLSSNVDELDALLADDLQAVGPDGRLTGKADDLAAHRTHIFRIDSLTRVSLTIKILKPDIAVTFVGMDIKGSIQDQPASGHYQYTRVWCMANGQWQITAAHISQVSA